MTKNKQIETGKSGDNIDFINTTGNKESPIDFKCITSRLLTKERQEQIIKGNKMFKVGLTGGIGSGKTYISQYFTFLGIPVFNSDIAARDLESNPEIQKAFKQILGDDIFIDGVLDRVRMRSIVFTDIAKLKKVNTVVIPFIKKEFEDFCIMNSSSPYCVFESAIIYETGSENYFNKIITVSADMHTRMERTLKRDKVTPEEVNNKFRVQFSDLQKESRADFIIKNESGVNLLDKVKSIHEKLIQMNTKKEVKVYPEIGGQYQHYKGGKYEVLTLAKHSETDEIMVVYKSIHFGSVHVRPLSMWFDLIPLGENVPPIERFKLIKLPKIFKRGSNN